eukprot:5242590-Pleurochrysis_carterae.AAC.2
MSAHHLLARSKMDMVYAYNIHCSVKYPSNAPWPRGRRVNLPSRCRVPATVVCGIDHLRKHARYPE